MKIEKIKLTEIEPASYNPRIIDDIEKSKLRNSINEFGLVDPIIINLKNNNTIIGGHQRYDTLLDIALEDNNLLEKDYNLLILGDIGWVFSDDELNVKDINHEKALNIALNKISGEWDTDKLNILLEELELENFNTNLTGFDELELEEINLSNDFNFDEVDDLNNFNNIEGEKPNKNFTVMISFITQDKANKFLENLGIPKKIEKESLIINEDELSEKYVT